MSNLGFDATKLMRTCLALLAAAMMIAATPGEALAKNWKHLAHHLCACHPAWLAQVDPPQAPSLGPMRYYGGPKSSMWRAAR